MMQEEDFVLTKISGDPDMSRFSCGTHSIDALIKESYYNTLLRYQTTLQILCQDIVVGYVSLRCKNICSAESQNGKFFTALYIEFLGIDVTYQRRGLGTKIMKYLIHYARTLHSKYPIRYVAFDALTTLVDWYKSFEFKADTKQPSAFSTLTDNGSTVLMYLDLIDPAELQKYHEILL